MLTDGITITTIDDLTNRIMDDLGLDEEFRGAVADAAGTYVSELGVTYEEIDDLDLHAISRSVYADAVAGRGDWSQDYPWPIMHGGEEVILASEQGGDRDTVYAFRVSDDQRWTDPMTREEAMALMRDRREP